MSSSLCCEGPNIILSPRRLSQPYVVRRPHNTKRCSVPFRRRGGCSGTCTGDMVACTLRARPSRGHHRISVNLRHIRNKGSKNDVVTGYKSETPGNAPRQRWCPLLDAVSLHVHQPAGRGVSRRPPRPFRGPDQVQPPAQSGTAAASPPVERREGQRCRHQRRRNDRRSINYEPHRLVVPPR